MKILNSLRTNLLYKLVALFLAVITYIYVQNEITASNDNFQNKQFLKKLNSKVVPVKVVLKGEPHRASLPEQFLLFHLQVTFQD